MTLQSAAKRPPRAGWHRARLAQSPSRYPLLHRRASQLPHTQPQAPLQFFLMAIGLGNSRLKTRQQRLRGRSEHSFERQAGGPQSSGHRFAGFLRHTSQTDQQHLRSHRLPGQLVFPSLLTSLPQSPDFARVLNGLPHAESLRASRVQSVARLQSLSWQSGSHARCPPARQLGLSQSAHHWRD